MEDAMIINKASEERGLAHGSIYKSEFVHLDHPSSYFARDPQGKNLEKTLDRDGFPYIGQRMSHGVPLYCYFDFDRGVYEVKKFMGKETCYLHSVKLCGHLGGRAVAKLACITYRVPVNMAILCKSIRFYTACICFREIRASVINSLAEQAKKAFVLKSGPVKTCLLQIQVG